ncbi:MAG: aminoacyl-tRNA hydrolase [Elusimicrobia bacterium]|nr:aminoacyl-tRNA hydrolase [Elusimicrobiota bacterium]
MALQLVVGLGNPGPEYARTRHNVGFRLADRLVGGADSFSNFKGLGVAARSGGLWVIKPMTYMNLSGEFVKLFASYHNVAARDMLVVYDELALPLGKIRLRGKGSSGGQKGMLSIIRHLGTEEVPRLRIGIGPQPEKTDAAAFVLGRFSKSQEKELDAALALAADAVGVALGAGIDAAMNRYNPST